MAVRASNPVWEDQMGRSVDELSRSSSFDSPIRDHQA